MTSTNAAVVLFSGGQDSTIALAWSLATYSRVYTVGVDYGQRNHVEMELRDHLRNSIPPLLKHGGTLCHDTVLDMGFIATLGTSALTGEGDLIVPEKGLPTAFVPGRNLLFITAAAALATRLGCNTVVTGVLDSEHTRYPDSRLDTIMALKRAVNLGMENQLRFVSPLASHTKESSWNLAYTLGGAPLVDLVRDHTHTCYNAARDVKHEWGYGCGTCPSCLARSAGFTAWKSKHLA